MANESEQNLTDITPDNPRSWEEVLAINPRMADDEYRQDNGVEYWTLKYGDPETIDVRYFDTSGTFNVKHSWDDGLLSIAQDVDVTDERYSELIRDEFGGGYHIFINDVQLPVTPDAITTTVNGKNEVVDLFNGGEYNIINKPGLTDIEFDALLPAREDPYTVNWKPHQYYLDLFEKLLDDKEERVCSFLISRRLAFPTLADSHFPMATLEGYTVKETVDNQMGDLVVSLHFKQFKPIKQPKLVMVEKEDGDVALQEEEAKDRVGQDDSGIQEGAKDKVKVTHKIKKGETLNSIAKKYNMSREQKNQLIEINEIDNPNFIVAGAELIFYN